MGFFDDLTWECHVCGDTRPDPVISVFKRTKTLKGGTVLQENIRYCNDRQECAAGAQTKTFLK